MKKSVLWIGIAAGLLAFAFSLEAKPRRPDQKPPDQKPTEQREKHHNAAVTGSAVKTISGKSQKLSNLSIQSSRSDETALRVQNGAAVVIDRLNVDKKGNASSEEDSNFYSLNAAVAVWQGASLSVKSGNVNTRGRGANALVAYGKNAQLQVRDLEIRTTQSSSRGLFATYGGKIEGENLKITTQGAHCAALATDRGGGSVIGRNIRSVTKGDGSPGIYSTGDIRATDSTFEAFGAEAAVIEGKNSILVKNCTLIGHRLCGMMLYQSFSGDAQNGTSVFTMSGGTLSAKSGPVFYITNTNAEINLSQAELVSGNGVLIEATSSRWGRRGSNGGHLKLDARKEMLAGDIVVNDISSVALTLGDDTCLKGAVNTKATAGKVTLELKKGSVWNVTADSSVDALFSEGKTLNDLRSKIISNGHVIHYRTKQGFLNGAKIALDHGGMLVYTPAPKASIKPDEHEEENQEQDGHRPPPPDDSNGRRHRGAPPFDEN